MTATDYLIVPENGQTWAYPLTVRHGFEDVPECLGEFTDNSGKIARVLRVPIGPVSHASLGTRTDHFKSQIREIIQNRMPVIVEVERSQTQIEAACILSEGHLEAPLAIQASLRCEVQTLTQLADFIAHTEYLRALYAILGSEDDLEQLIQVAKDMTFESGLYLPVTVGTETAIARLEAKTNDGTFGVTVLGNNALPEKGQPLFRRTTWKQRGKTVPQVAEAVIGVMV